MARPKTFTNIKQLQKKIDEYFEECDIKEKPYTMSGLALSLDIDRKTLYRYETLYDEFCPTIKRAKQKVEAQLEENALMNKANPTFTIFNLKNNFEWKDKQEVQNTFEETNTQIQNIADLINKPQKVRTEKDLENE